MLAQIKSGVTEVGSRVVGYLIRVFQRQSGRGGILLERQTGAVCFSCICDISGEPLLRTFNPTDSSLISVEPGACPRWIAKSKFACKSFRRLSLMRAEVDRVPSRGQFGITVIPTGQISQCQPA